MFGQSNTTPFGSPPATSPFGAPQQQQQTSAFGAPAPSAFGGGSTFGQQPQQTTTFGAPQQQQQQQSAFGGGSAFGSTTPAPSTGGFGAFGSTATTTTQTSPFGAPAPAPGGLFGNAPAPSGGLFGGGTSTTTGFGASTQQQPTFGTGGGAFGSSTSTTFGAPAATTFGAPAQQSTSIFGGSPTPAPTAFGSTAPSSSGSIFGSTPAAGSSVFGSTAPVGGGSMFGQQQQQQQGVNGTAAIPFQPTQNNDGTSSSSIVFQSITAMPQYEASGKSFEELRFDDYSQGNRGTGTQSNPQSGGFGITTSTFGAAPAPTTGGIFGSTPAPAPAFGGFGAPAPAPTTGGLFGSTPAPAPAFGGFGTTPTPAPASGSLFGSTPAPAPAFGGFGAPAPAPTGGLFGAPAPAPGAFGSSTPAPAPGGLFGSTPAPAPSGFGFGSSAPAPAPGGLFGSAPAPSGSLFGAPAPAPGGLFGSTPAPAPSGLFGSTPAPAPSGFGSFGQAPAPTTAFGAPAGGSSLFGSPAPAPATGGFFGSAPAPAPGSLFGAPATAQPAAAQPFASPPAVIIPPATDAVLQQQMAAIENKRKEVEQMERWRGGSSQAASVIPLSNPESSGLRVSPYSASSMSSAVPYRASPRSTAKIRPRGFESPKLASSQKTPLRFMSPDGYVASATKRLVIKSTTPKPTMRLRLRDVAGEESKEDVRDDVILTLPAVSPPTESNVASPPAAMETPGTVTSPPAGAPDSATTRVSTPASTEHGRDFYNKIMAGATPGSKKKSPESLAPKLTMEGYTVSPSLEEMASMSEAELATVSGFTVTRTGVGSVSWEGSVDVRGVDLDEIITIENRDVAVYDKAEKNGDKPAVGTKLNRSAVLTMYGVYPKAGSDAAAIEKFERKIVKATKGMNAELISYNLSDGVWKFRVPHFSRYALLDDSDDDDEDMEVAATEPIAQNFESGERGGRSPEEVGTGEESEGTMDVGASWFGAFRSEDEDMLDVAVVTGKENDGRENVIQAAERHVKMMATSIANDRAQQIKQKSILKKQKKKEKQREEATAHFPDEGFAVDDEATAESVPVKPTKKELSLRSGPGICARIAQKCGIQSFSASSTDYGMRMGRSFRVGWRPDGSFLHLQPGSAVVIQQSRPVLTNGTVGLKESADMLESHLINSEKVTSPLRECPVFSLCAANGKLRKALTDYVAASTPQGNNTSDPEEGLVLMRAFSLLLALFTKEGGDGSGAVDVAMIEGAEEGKARTALKEKDRIDSCIKWLTAACAQDVRNDIREAMRKNDVYSAIYAAAAGGDIEEASAIAIEHGYLHLASLLAAGAAAFDSIREQVQQWHESCAAATIPAGLRRLYSILGGDLSAEQQLHLRMSESRQSSDLDWRRRLCMLLTFGVHPDDEATLSSLIQTYEDEVMEKTSPYPSPRYVWNSNIAQESGPKSLLFKILDLVKTIDDDESEVGSLANVVAPSGYTAAVTDFSGAFHVAAAISALGVGAGLSPMEQGQVLDSYASQLINSGRWDLAVYVMLCSFRADCPQDLVLRERMAKSIVLQNCPEGAQGETIPKRAELESIGVPSAWFEEALAYRCGNRGESFEYVKHLSEFSPEEARKALEEIVVPNMLFMSSADVQHSLNLLAAFSWDENSLAATVVDFFQLAEDIIAISKPEFDAEKKQEEITALSDLAEFVKTRLQAHRSRNDEIRDDSCSLRVIPSYRVVPTSAFLAEAITGIKFLQLQLGALAAGSSIWDDAYLRGKSNRPLKVASELAFISARNARNVNETTNDMMAMDSPVTLAGVM